MSKATYTTAQIALSDLVGVGMLQLAAILLILDWRLAAVPLVLYVAFSGVAPFLHRVSYFLPIISHGPRNVRQVALTFDDGPDPQTTPHLLDLLERYGLRATFFVVGERARRHPELISAILANGHELGNHSDRHDPWLMLRSRKRLAADLAACQQAVADAGVYTRVFRPPVGITNARLRGALAPLGLHCVTFDCRAKDRGNRRIDGLAQRILRGVRPGSIVLLHDRAPRQPEATGVWLEEVSSLLRELRSRNLAPVLLSKLLGIEVNRPTHSGRALSPVKAFYDDLAPQYDREQEIGGGAGLREIEAYQIRASLLSEVRDEHLVLEVGAGTGRFTESLAQRAREVVAVDLSSRMLAQLRVRLAQKGTDNIHCLVADLSQLPLAREFDVICSFSCIEYIPDRATVLRDLANRLRPGGVLYLTTAHRCLFRFFVQIGNALRQGVWLHTSSRSSLRRALQKAGLDVEVIRTHGLRFGPFGGLLLEVKARRPKDPAA